MRQRLGVGNLVGHINVDALQVARYKTDADAFGDGATFGVELAVGVMAEERRALRVGQADLDGRVALAQGHGGAGQGAASTHRADKAVNLAFGLIPDFRASGLVVNVAVGRVVELSRPDHTVRVFGGKLLGQAFGGVDVVIRVIVTGGLDQSQVGAVQVKQFDFFLAQ